jgi:hypothetical protein
MGDRRDKALISPTLPLRQPATYAEEEEDEEEETADSRPRGLCGDDCWRRTSWPSPPDPPGDASGAVCARYGLTPTTSPTSSSRTLPRLLPLLPPLLPPLLSPLLPSLLPPLLSPLLSPRPAVSLPPPRPPPRPPSRHDRSLSCCSVYRSYLESRPAAVAAESFVSSFVSAPLMIVMRVSLTYGCNEEGDIDSFVSVVPFNDPTTSFVSVLSLTSVTSFISAAEAAEEPFSPRGGCCCGCCPCLCVIEDEEEETEEAARAEEEDNKDDAKYEDDEREGEEEEEGRTRAARTLGSFILR